MWLDIRKNGHLVDDESGELLGESQKHGLHADSLLLFCFSYHMTRNVLSSALFELARNAEVQRRTRAEIARLLLENCEYNYGTVEKMVYLQQVLDGEEENL